MAIFNSFLYVYQRVTLHFGCSTLQSFIARSAIFMVKNPPVAVEISYK